MTVQPLNSFTDDTGVSWLRLSNGHKIQLPASAAGVTDHGALTGLGDDDHPQYVKDTGDTMTGNLTVQARVNVANGLVLNGGTDQNILHFNGGVTAGDIAGISWSDANRLIFITNGQLRVAVSTTGAAAPLEVASPTVATHAATKNYVDLREAATQVATVDTDWNDTIAPGPFKQLMLGSWPNGPGTGNYYYLTNYTYGANLTQYAIPYSQTITQPVRIRSYYSSSGWTRWSVVGDPAMAPTRPGTLRLFNRGTDSIANNTTTKLTGGWTTLAGDTGNGGPLSYSSGIVTFGETGYYDVTVYTQWAAGTAGNIRRTELLQNDIAVLRDDRSPPTPTAFSASTLTGSGMYMAAGWTMQVAVFQNSGATMNLNNGRWQIRKVSGAPE